MNYFGIIKETDNKFFYEEYEEGLLKATCKHNCRHYQLFVTRNMVPYVEFPYEISIHDKIAKMLDLHILFCNTLINKSTANSGQYFVSGKYGILSIVGPIYGIYLYKGAMIVMFEYKHEINVAKDSTITYITADIYYEIVRKTVDVLKEISAVWDRVEHTFNSMMK